MNKQEIKETIETLNLDINAKVAKFEKKFETDKWKRFYLKLSLLVVVGLSVTIIVCQTNVISEYKQEIKEAKTECTKQGWEVVFNDGMNFAIDSTNRFWNSERVKDSINDYYLAHRNELHFSLHH